MKTQRLITFVLIGLMAGFAATGCKKKPQRTTPLPQGTAGVGAPGGNEPIGGGRITQPDSGLKPSDLEGMSNKDGISSSNQRWEDMAQDRSKFQAYTVYFDFDSSVVKASEKTKTEAIAKEFNAGPATTALLIEGHCDERGTTEYNRALGERRAQALREVLAAAGVSPARIHTVSFGEDKPAVIGHDESAWSKNRRGEFILLSPK